MLGQLVQRIAVLRFTKQDARRFGVMRATVRERARNARDRLIAAHAVSVGLTLVANNAANFRDYPDLQVENWASPA